MKRLFVGLVLLLMAFFSTLDHMDGLQRVAARAGGQRWMIEAVLALAIVGLFVRASQLHRRLLFPRRGVRLLLAGIVFYALGVAVATGTLVGAAGMLPADDLGALAGVTHYLPLLTPLPLFVAAQVLLVLGVFRALTNLVPPQEFAEDF
jgi:hypothetical protein